jgi:hypothetical protein
MIMVIPTTSNLGYEAAYSHASLSVSHTTWKKKKQEILHKLWSWNLNASHVISLPRCRQGDKNNLS